MTRCSIGFHKWTKWEPITISKTFNQSYYRGMCGYTPNVTITTTWKQRQCLRCRRVIKKNLEQTEKF